MNEIIIPDDAPTYEETVAADLAAKRDARLQEKFNRLGTFGVGINPMDLIAISVDSLIGVLMKLNVITQAEFDEARLTLLEEMVDNTLAQIAKPKLHLVKP